jgi:DNA polymerase III subunit alpha
MSKLNDLYDSKNVSYEDRIKLEKDVVFVVPDKNFDLAKCYEGFGISPFEVAVTWPKDLVSLDEEIDAFNPKCVLQVGCEISKRYATITSEGTYITDELASVSDSLSDEFVCLHHHDEFSIKDGLGTVYHMIKLLKAQRRSFCCITNHGSVSGWIKQYNACKKAGIKAIFGMEAYVSNYRGNDPEKKKEHRSANHLVLIANSEEGFYNIIKIHNDAQLKGFYYTPRANREAFEKWGKGITASSACMAGELSKLLMEDKNDEAKETWEFYNRVFDKFYVEIQVIEHDDQKEANRRLIRFAQSVGAPLLLTCDSHYLDPDYSETHDVLMCSRQKRTILDKREKDDVWSFDVRNLFYRNADQMRDVFKNGFTDEEGNKHTPFEDDVFTEKVFNEAMYNTRQVAVGVQNIILDSKIKLPKLYDNGKEVLRKKLNEGFIRLGLNKSPNRDEYLKMLKHEFSVITRTGWGDYFLVMEKIISDTIAKFGEWSTGPGRGSAAGSLASYCLGLTYLDPIEYGLLFERFLDESRPDPPDIDTDFKPEIRDWVKQHIVELFGSNKVCSIGTYATYKTRAVILDVARVLGEDLMEVTNVTKRIEPLRSFEDEDGEEQKVDQMEFDDLCEHYPELKAYFEAHPRVRYHAEILRNQVKNMGTHAGGVIISDLDLQDRIPVLYDKQKRIVSAWAESGSVQELSAVGLVKFDILGLNALPIISDCMDLIEKTTGVRIPRSEIPVSDREAIYMGSKADLVGIFQFENPVTKPIADAVGMESLEDVAAITSLIRPGPMDAMIGDKKAPFAYAARKRGERYEAPEFLREALNQTYGIMVYQEQIMNISKVLSGFTPAEANKLRKACGKKIQALMDEMTVKLLKGAKPRIDAGEITEDEVKEIILQIETFAGYGFNKAHAVCYGAITTTELWLKHNFPIQFITALVNNTKQGKKKNGSSNILVDYINYARRREIPVLGPDVNASGKEFRIEKDSIRFALGHVKNVAKAALVIEKFQPFTGMADFYERVKIEPKDEVEEKPESDGDEQEDQSDGEGRTPEEVEELKKILLEEMAKPKKRKAAARRPTRKVVESLIDAGAFDCFGDRNKMLTEYYKCRKEKELPEDRTVEAWQVAEEEVLGLCLTKPILYKQYEEMIRQEGWYLISEIDPDKKKVMVFGEVTSIRQHISKAGNAMHIVHLSDGIDTMKFFVFQGGWDNFKDNFKTGTIGVIPMAKFQDSDGGTRFYDDRGRPVVLKKG